MWAQTYGPLTASAGNPCNYAFGGGGDGLSGDLHFVAFFVFLFNSRVVLPYALFILTLLNALGSRKRWTRI